MSCFSTQNLLSDAEVGEDFFEDGWGGDLSGDGAQVVHAFADVLADEVSAEPLAQCVDGSAYCLAGVAQGLVVADVGH